MSTERQRSRLLEATFAVVAEEGYREMTVGRVAARASLSRRTFYELFSDREDCFLYAFDYALDVLVERARPAFESEREWVAGVRAGLAALLECLDREPALRRLVFVEALAAGPRVLARRTEVLEALAAVVDGGRARGRAPQGLPSLVAEGVVGAVFGVIHARIFQRRPEPLAELLDSLMATIVLPYRGSAAAAGELARATATAARELEPAASQGRGVAGGSQTHGPAGSQTHGPAGSQTHGPAGSQTHGPADPSPGSTVRVPWDASVPSVRGVSGRPLGSSLPADFRLTVRTQMALTAIARLNGAGVNPTNRTVSEEIGVNGRGQVSYLMARLRSQGLIEDTGGRGRGAPKAWRLTRHGEAVLDAHRGGRASSRTGAREIVRGGKLAPKRGRRVRSAPARPASAGFRLTVRTQLVLTAVAENVGASNREIAAAAGIRDQGQISKLLARLADRGLVHNAAHATAGFPKAWRLTPSGEALLHATRTVSERAA
jgi:AcrR family transcriptional regulator/DNA-binding MarR family transcriptional regulator